jgi:hypothetical protein
MRRLGLLCSAALVCLAACSAFTAAPSSDPADAAVADAEAGAPDGVDGAASEGGGPRDASADARTSTDASADAAVPGVTCADLGPVDFCSDFDDGLLPGPWTGIIPGPLGPFVIASSALSIALPTDSVPTASVLYHDVPAAKKMAFGFDVQTTKAWTMGDYVELFAIDDSGDGGGSFSLKVRLTPTGELIVDVKGTQIADLGTAPLAQAVRITGTLEFGASAVQFTLARDGANVAANPVAAVPQPASLRVMAGLVYAEAQGGGAIILDTVMVDRLP